MTSITIQDGKVVLRDGAVGTGQACCCQDPCADECDGDGVPQELEITIDSATFGPRAQFDEDDLPFEVPATFIVPRQESPVCILQWSAAFFPRDTLCKPCGTGGFGVSTELALNVGVVSANTINVQVLLASGARNNFGNCLGLGSNLLASLTADICSLPINATVTNADAGCFISYIESVDVTIKAA